MHLNGWQRIGIVASVIWAPLGAFWSLGQLYNPIYDSYRSCMAAVTEFHFCTSSRDDALAVANGMRPVFALLGALIPIAVLWLAGYVVAWVRRGFRGAPK